MMSGKQISIFVFILVLLCGCGGQGPQRPSQRKGETPQHDSTQLALLQLNKDLAESADKQLLQLVQTQDESYALYEGGAWITILDRGDTDSPTPQRGEEWVIHMQVYDLNGKRLKDSEGTYTIGKQELPIAIEFSIREWHRGCRIRMFVPWYSAFGMQGTNDIPPYENVMIELELK
jgi:hypothetical protein